MSTFENTGSSNAAIPTAAQLGESRLKQWHQQGEALLTIENLRSWINAAGLVLFAPRPQIVCPTPSLVEAVLGTPTPTPTLDQTTQAKSLLARLVAEGLAVPLNLLGATNGVIGEVPDFVCSTAVFSYVFTLRGDKAWKQPPATSGALKVSPLALATREALAKRGATSVYDLTTELGKEVTEAAVLRALGELWTHLRVLPLTPPDGGPALWELSSARFLKQIKAGANAGQPSALSALISLYLGQAIVASEEEIESFLSPLAARSRIRDVIHALLPARQLETIAVEGRTMLHVAGDLPAFLAPEPGVAEGDAEATAVEGRPDSPADDANAEGAPRITKYVPKPKKIGTGYLAKAAPSKFATKSFGAKPFGGSKFGSKPGFKPRDGAGPAPDRERRPFNKPGIDYAARGFDKPWEEEKARRLASASRPSSVEGATGEFAASDAAPSEPRASRPYTREGGRPSFGNKPSFGGKPGFGRKPSFGSRPPFNSEGRPPRREFTPRTDGDAPRKTFSKPGTFGRKREGFGGKPSFGDKPSFGSRPSFGSDSRPPRREFAPRTDRGDRPSFSGPRAPGSFSPRPRFDKPQGDRSDRPQRSEGGFAARKPYPPRGAGFFSNSPRPADSRPSDGGARERSDRGSSTESGKRVYKKFDAPRDRPARGDQSARPARPFSSDRPARPQGSGGYAGKPSGGFGDRKPAGRPGGGFAGKSGGDFAPRRPSGKPGGGSFGKKPFGKPGGSFASRPGSTFAKFADNAKPFGKRSPTKKYKAGGDTFKGDESA